MTYEKELTFITDKIRQAYDRFAKGGPSDIRQKSAFDLVTEVDVNIERFLTKAILAAFPGDRIPEGISRVPQNLQLPQNLGVKAFALCQIIQRFAVNGSHLRHT